MGIKLSVPNRDEIEVSVFGPGYGESCLVFFGGGWLVIDSCIDADSGRPAPLVYLESLGVNVAEDVKLIIASHWHDDHVRGLSSIVERCVKAQFCTSAALTRHEFVSFLTAHDHNRALQAGSGTREIVSTLRILHERKSHCRVASASTRLLQLAGTETGHGRPVEVWSLSPSAAQFEEFLKDVGTLVPGMPKGRATATSPNHVSVVTRVSIGSEALLFGADLEETGQPDFGWSALASDKAKPTGKALFFKIPHHGSRTAHHHETWESLVDKNAACVLTPWKRNSGLPTKDDVNRLMHYTSRGFSTSDLKVVPHARRINRIEKQIKEFAKLTDICTKVGQVQLRRNLNDASESIELSENACDLAHLLTVVK